MKSRKPPCPGATRRGVAPTLIRGGETSQCRGFEAAVPYTKFTKTVIYQHK